MTKQNRSRQWSLKAAKLRCKTDEEPDIRCTVCVHCMISYHKKNLTPPTSCPEEMHLWSHPAKTWPESDHASSGTLCNDRVLYICAVHVGLNSWNVASATEKLNMYLYLFVIHFNVNSLRWCGAALLKQHSSRSNSPWSNSSIALIWSFKTICFWSQVQSRITQRRKCVRRTKI